MKKCKGRLLKLLIIAISVMLCLNSLSIGVYASWDAADPKEAVGKDVSIVYANGDTEMRITGTDYDWYRDYNTPRDEITQYVNFRDDIYNEENYTKNLQTCYQQFLAWGINKWGAAAMCGNIFHESHAYSGSYGQDWSLFWLDNVTPDSGIRDRSTLVCNGIVKQDGDFYIRQGHNGGGLLNLGSDCGMGLIQFTSEPWIKLLFAVAGDMGKPWYDMSVQLKVLDYSYGPEYFKDKDVKEDPLFASFYDSEHKGAENLTWGSYSSVDMSSFTEDEKAVARMTLAYMAYVEGPVGGSEQDRVNNAITYFNNFKDLEARDITGSGGSGISSGSNDSTIQLQGGTIKGELELTGMPVKSGLISEDVHIYLPTESDVEKDFTVEERYNLYEINKNRELSKQFNAWTTARVVLVFFGLLLIVYAILLGLSLIFDRVNTIFTFSLVNMITMGKLKYSNDILSDEEKSKYSSSRRIVLSVVVLIVVGGLFISGGVLPAVMKSVYSFTNWIQGWI